MKWLERLMLRLGMFYALPVMFADGDGDGGDDGDGDDGDGDGGDDGDDGDAGGDDPKDVEGLKKALDAERAARTQAEKDSKKNARAIKDLNKEIDRIKASSATDEEKKAAEIREGAAKEERERLAKPIKRAAIRAGASGRLANPAVAVRLVDLDDIEIDDDGEVDEDSVKAAIDRILEEMPDLKAKGAAKSGADTGSGKNGGGGEQDMNDLLRQAVTGRK
jgi:hypothetical protein